MAMAYRSGAIVPRDTIRRDVVRWNGPAIEDEDGTDSWGENYHEPSQSAQSPRTMLDLIVPRPGGMSLWDLPNNKLKTAAIASVFIVTAGFITFMAAGGLLAIMLTGAVVTFGVLLMVLVCTGLVALLVTGVPAGYAVYHGISSHRSRRR